MKKVIASNDPHYRIKCACRACLTKSEKLPQNKSKQKFGLPIWISGECDVCHGIKEITDIKYFDNPYFLIRMSGQELLYV